MAQKTENPVRTSDRHRHVVEQLLALRTAGALDFRETAPGRGIWKWSFRAGGWPVDVLLDESVLEVRVYHARDEVAMGRVEPAALAVLLGRAAPPAGERASADEAMAGLRAIVAEWKKGNARIFISPPRTQGHPDNWNRA